METNKGLNEGKVCLLQKEREEEMAKILWRKKNLS